VHAKIKYFTVLLLLLSLTYLVLLNWFPITRYVALKLCSVEYFIIRQNLRAQVSSFVLPFVTWGWFKAKFQFLDKFSFILQMLQNKVASILVLQITVVVVVVTSHQTHYRSYRGRFLRVRWPNQQCQAQVTIINVHYAIPVYNKMSPHLGYCINVPRQNGAEVD